MFRCACLAPAPQYNDALKASDSVDASVKFAATLPKVNYDTLGTFICVSFPLVHAVPWALAHCMPLCPPSSGWADFLCTWLNKLAKYQSVTA